MATYCVGLKHVFGGKIEGRIKEIERRGRKRKQLLVGLNEMSGYCGVKEEALDRTVRRTRFERSCDPLLRETTTE